MPWFCLFDLQITASTSTELTWTEKKIKTWHFKVWLFNSGLNWPRQAISCSIYQKFNFLLSRPSTRYKIQIAIIINFQICFMLNRSNISFLTLKHLWFQILQLLLRSTEPTGVENYFSNQNYNISEPVAKCMKIYWHEEIEVLCEKFQLFKILIENLNCLVWPRYIMVVVEWGEHCWGEVSTLVCQLWPNLAATRVAKKRQWGEKLKMCEEKN